MSSTGYESPSNILRYIRSHGLQETPDQVRLRDETAQMPNGSWASPPEQAALIQQLIRLTGAQRVLEVGTFTGCTTLAMALSLDETGTVVTCDAAGGWSEMGVHFWRASRVENRIDRRIGRAAEVLDGLLREGERGKFDLVFLDADKAGYGNYLDPITHLLRPGGILVAGGVLGDGKVADSEADDEDTRVLQAFNRRLHTEGQYYVSMLPIGDGVTIAIKK